MTKPVVCNAGPIIHLDQLGCLDVLSDYPAVFVPESVWTEVLKHRPSALPQPFLIRREAPKDIDPIAAALARAFSLDAGEAACLTLLAGMRDAMFLTDDGAARLVGNQIGLEVHGTIGVLLRSIRTGKRTPQHVLAVLNELPGRSTLFISRDILDQTRREIGRRFGLPI